jgi:hypothetical protein
LAGNGAGAGASEASGGNADDGSFQVAVLGPIIKQVAKSVTKKETKRVQKVVKQQSPVWRELKPSRGQRKTDGKNYYEWDYTHGNIEVYNSRGKHLGVMDPTTGKMIGRPLSGRDIKF